jgi:hypothetical protein
MGVFISLYIISYKYWYKYYYKKNRVEFIIRFISNQKWVSISMARRLYNLTWLNIIKGGAVNDIDEFIF